MTEERPPDNVTFSAIDRSHLYERVAAELREAIFSGSLRPGAPLPTERELTASFGVSRATVRDALRALKSEGLVCSNGTRTVVAEGTADPLMQALTNLVQLNRLDLRDLRELRVVLELAVVRLAAQRGDETTLAPVREALATMRANIGDHRVVEEADVRFHVELAKASGNGALHLVMLALRELMGGHLLEYLATIDEPEAEQLTTTLAAEHEEILRAVEERDGVRAARLALDHLNRFYSDLDAIYDRAGVR